MIIMIRPFDCPDIRAAAAAEACPGQFTVQQVTVSSAAAPSWYSGTLSTAPIAPSTGRGGVTDDELPAAFKLVTQA